MMAEVHQLQTSLYVLPVNQPYASDLAAGRTRQISRGFPCESKYIGEWVAIQATNVPDWFTPQEIDKVFGPRWSIVGVGKLAGIGLHGGFTRKRSGGFGKAYNAEGSQSGPWVWTFTDMVYIAPIALNRLDGNVSSYVENVAGRNWKCVDDGDGSRWSCCPRPLQGAMVKSVREARRKAKAR